MSGPRRHTADVSWTRAGATAADYRRGRYSRAHVFRFDGGAEVPASASPSHVPAGCADAGAVDPEEAFVAALSSCHMLFFLHLASQAGHVVDAYRDEAWGLLDRDADGRESMTVVTLRPAVRFAGQPPDADAIERLHHAAHAACYIANSVKTDVRVEPAAG